MNNETNRLAHIIANAADKELAVRHDGQPKRQDKAAAEAIEAEYLFIRRSELPPVKEHPSYAEAGGWVLAGPDDNDLSRVRASLAGYASWYIHLQAKEDAAREAEQELARRRDTLAEQYFELKYEDLEHAFPKAQPAIDRIIELENKAA
jgi:hypothetical protein